MSLLHMKIRARAWSGRGISTIIVIVDEGVVFVWDDLGTQFTRRHNLSPRAEKRIRAAYAARIA
jgi:hypothetical protein